MSSRASGGFTLIETLVAVTLLALMLGALLPVFQGGLTALGRGDRHLRATQLAESLLAREAALIPDTQSQPAQPAEASGDEGGFSWSVTREPYAGDDGAPPLEEDSPLVLVKVSAVVAWDENPRGVRLSTLAVERAQ